MDIKKSTDILIIGAGLTGLTAAVELIKHGRSVTILESRERIGGRILTIGSKSNQPIELGATWLGIKHEHLNSLLSELAIPIFKQKIGGRAVFEPISTSPPYVVSVPETDTPSYRIAGGTDKLIQSLYEKLQNADIHLSEKVLSIEESEDGLKVQSQKAIYHAKKVISTVPPNLLVNQIKFIPSLPDDFLATAKSTHTWMDDSIKVALTYSEPFWSEPPTSGTIVSNVGPVSEMYDHSNYENSFFALMGFISGSYYTLTKEERREKIINQLVKYYGAVAKSFLSYEEMVWRTEADTFYPYNAHIVPHQNNGNEIYQNAQMKDRFIIAGTETSKVFPGYMEGAVFSGHYAAELAKQ